MKRTQNWFVYVIKDTYVIKLSTLLSESFKILLADVVETVQELGYVIITSKITCSFSMMYLLKISFRVVRCQTSMTIVPTNQLMVTVLQFSYYQLTFNSYTL